MKLNVVKTRWIWFSFSGLLIGASVLGLALFGLNFGIDFTGGTLMDVTIASAPSTDAVRSHIDSLGFAGTRVQTSDAGEYLIRLPSVSEEQHQEILGSLQATFGETEEQRFDFVGPVIGQELQEKALWSVGAILVLIVLYVAWAFRKVSDPVASWKFGVLTMVTALHDVILPIGLFAFLGHFLEYQVDAGFIAAILTILGYSINDTIVVFDRTRENLHDRSSAESFPELVNKSVNQTLARSLNTTITTLLALVAVFFFGGETMQPFALALIIGIATGAYSSIFIASPLLVAMERGRK